MTGRLKRDISSGLRLLECTLRDGSYAVDFRFTRADTALLCQLLSDLGFDYLEIGHGLGINASNAGKGQAPSSDLEFVNAAKSVTGRSKVGMFCIPNVATLNSLKEMAQAGLDFVRIGNNADKIEDAFDYIEAARKNNLHTFLNFMKSYAVTPKTFALKAKAAAKAGAQVIYIVDSAGCMLPEEVDEYIRRLKEVSEVKIGFHGHNNLHLAVANTLQAIRSGADFVDTTLYGIGRNAGNAPTEVVLAVLKTMDIDLKIDLFKVMDVVDRYVSPLARQFQMYDMLSVTMGFSKFHSSFLPKVKKISDEYNVDLRKLLFKAGRENPSEIDEAELIEYAKQLQAVSNADRDHLLKGHNLVSFVSAKIRQDFLSSTIDSVGHLMEELINVSAKNRLNIVLDIVPLAEREEGLVFTEYITSDKEMVMGRIKFGSPEMLSDIMDMIKKQKPYMVVNNDINVGWISSEEIFLKGEECLGAERVIFYSLRELIASYIIEAVLNRKKRLPSGNLLIIGTEEQIHLTAYRLANFFDCVFINYLDSVSSSKAGEFDRSRLPQNCVPINFPLEEKEMDLNVATALTLVPLPKEAIERIAGGLPSLSSFIFLNYPGQPQDYNSHLPEGITAVNIDPSLAYHGQFLRWIDLR